METGIHNIIMQPQTTIQSKSITTDAATNVFGLGCLPNDTPYTDQYYDSSRHYATEEMLNPRPMPQSPQRVNLSTYRYADMDDKSNSYFIYLVGNQRLLEVLVDEFTFPAAGPRVNRLAAGTEAPALKSFLYCMLPVNRIRTFN